MDVEGWLKSLGLEQYETAFHENGVNPEILRHLTADDLKELGVIAVGHRRQLLVAIAKLQDDSAPLQAAEPSGNHEASTSADDAVSSSTSAQRL